MGYLIAVVDDEKIFLDRIEKAIEKMRPKWTVFCCSQDTKKLKNADAYFLDIELGKDKNKGFKIAQRMKKADPLKPVIFITSHDELVVEGYKYDALRYIRKSNMKKELPDAIKALDKYFMSHCRMIDLFDDNRILITLKIKDIQYVYSQGNYVICVDRKSREYKSRGTLNKFVEQLGDEFVSPSPRYYINPSYIKNIEQDETMVRMANGSKIDISRRNQKAVLCAFARRQYADS